MLAKAAEKWKLRVGVGAGKRETQASFLQGNYDLVDSEGICTDIYLRAP